MRAPNILSGSPPHDLSIDAVLGHRFRRCDLGVRNHARRLLFVLHPLALHEFVPQYCPDSNIGWYRVGNPREFMEHGGPHLRLGQLGGIRGYPLDSCLSQ